MNSAPPAKIVGELLPKLHSEQLSYFPIRHHSPACAAHIARWIETHQPASVLVEGPASFTSLIDLLVDDQCVCPVAIYTSFVDKKGRLFKGKASGPTDLFGPPRFAAYYPFCDYSPELVALRVGRSVGARLKFIDLEYGEMILAKRAIPTDEKESVRVEDLAADPHLRHSEFIQTLAQRMGCRDFNELWDHLFEACVESLDTAAFVDRLAAWCAMARIEYTDDSLDRDGTAAREACMAAAIVDELLSNDKEGRDGPVLVVTGGFHTVALPALVEKKVKRPKPISFEDDQAGSWLMRYSFDQLDALAGYASGMPSPAFYDRMWHAGKAEEAAAHMIVEIGRLTRQRQFPSAISTPDAIAAVQMTRQLARLRGHPHPLREDVLDGIRSCFVKGELDAEGRLVMNLVREVLAGSRIGRIPAGAGVPPIVDDFHDEARKLRLPVDNVESREMTLDLYRKTNHRRISRLFHRLDLLQAPFAGFLGGPDFVQGTGLDLMQERWHVQWSPATESALIEASVFGPTLEEAAAAKLRQQIAHLEDEGQGRNTDAAVTMLIRACRMGLHDQTPAIVALIDLHIAEDPALPSVVKGLSQLELLQHSREPLEATRLTAVPELMQAAYQRACRLVNDVATCPDELVNEIIKSLQMLREVLAGQHRQDEPTFDADLFHHALQRVANHSPSKAQAAIVGAAAGILFSEGKYSDAELIRIVQGYLGGSITEARKACGVLRGILATAREAAWHVRELLRAVDGIVNQWDEDTFLEALPELRLAFADLTPREITRVADQVAEMHGEATLGELVHMDIEESEVQFALRINQLVKETLQADGLIKE